MDDWMESFPNAGTTELYEKIGQEPKFLDVDMDAVFVDTPLHKVVRKGLREVTLEILQLMPSQGRKLNAEGYSPLQIALSAGNEDLVRAMIKQDAELIRVAGRGLITPLHYAAEKDMAELVAMFLLYCPDSIEDLTARGETAVHVAVRKESKEAFKVLYGWVKWKVREQVLKLRDWEGKNVFELADESHETDQTEIKKILDLESDEKSKLKTMWKEFRSMKFSWKNMDPAKLLLHSSSGSSHSAFVNYLSEFSSPDEASDRRFSKSVNTLEIDKRNAIMVVAVLIATATFQAMLSPPGGFNDHNPITNSNYSSTITSNAKGNKNGPFMMSTGDYATFAAVNTIAFVVSLIAILCTVPLSLFSTLLNVSVIFLTVTYVLAIKITSPDRKTFIASAVLLPFYIFVFCVCSVEWNAPDKDETYWKICVDEDHYAALASLTEEQEN